jgi:hypothetical protein
MFIAAALHFYVFVHERVLCSRPATQCMSEVEPQDLPSAVSFRHSLQCLARPDASRRSSSTGPDVALPQPFIVGL